MICVFMQHPLILNICRTMADYSLQECQDICPKTDEFRGIEFMFDTFCRCLYDADSAPSAPAGFSPYEYSANGPVASVNGANMGTCFKYHPV